MVECEYRWLHIGSDCGECFNRYMVECEYACCYSHSGIKSGFNRYMVECELYRMCRL